MHLLHVWLMSARLSSPYRALPCSISRISLSLSLSVSHTHTSVCPRRAKTCAHNASLHHSLWCEAKYSLEKTDEGTSSRSLIFAVKPIVIPNKCLFIFRRLLSKLRAVRNNSCELSHPRASKLDVTQGILSLSLTCALTGHLIRYSRTNCTDS